jgi:hypothetical protein
MVNSIIPASSNDSHIFLNQFLLFLKFPLDDTIQSGGSAGYDKALSEESILDGLL